MHAMLPLLKATDFPSLKRNSVSTLQMNLGYTCNQACFHCHVNASPKRKEQMDRETIDTVLEYIRNSQVNTLDLTGGAPEMNVDFKYLITEARKLGTHVIDRCNLTILNEPGYEDMAQFLADNQVEVVASLPCYLEDNVDSQRGDGVFQSSLKGLKQLNDLGYGKENSGLTLTLVYNPIGANLPPNQEALESEYKKELKARYNVDFNQLFTITNMPIQRFGSTLVSKGEFDGYMQLLRDSYKPENVKGVMCRDLVSVDYQGYLYDCDFNQMLDMPIRPSVKPAHIKDLLTTDIKGHDIMIADHCYGCTAGQGSSCGGALD